MAVETGGSTNAVGMTIGLLKVGSSSRYSSAEA